MEVFIVLENTEAFGGSPKEVGSIIKGIFFDQRRAEDFVRGMLSYMNSYDNENAVFEKGRVQKDDIIYFEIIRGISL